MSKIEPRNTGSIQWLTGAPIVEKEYLVFMYEENVQDPAITVAQRVNGSWFPDAGDRRTILYWADMDCLMPVMFDRSN